MRCINLVSDRMLSIDRVCRIRSYYHPVNIIYLSIVNAKDHFWFDATVRALINEFMVRLHHLNGTRCTNYSWVRHIKMKWSQCLMARFCVHRNRCAYILRAHYAQVKALLAATKSARGTRPLLGRRALFRLISDPIPFAIRWTLSSCSVEYFVSTVTDQRESCNPLQYDFHK